MRHIVLGISGGIAAYKSVSLCRELTCCGAQVRCVMTASATRFVTAHTLQALTGTAPRSALFDTEAEAAMSHIELARWADTLLIAPASANTLARLANGLADDLLSTVYLATDAEIVIAPAMNHLMWRHPATQNNVRLLNARERHTLLPVGYGEQACGEIGPGRMLEPQEIIAALNQAHDHSWRGIRLTLTAGPTHEAIDPVRYLSNYSSGKMGYALAAAAQRRGAQVTLISGPTALPSPVGCRLIAVTSAEEMHQAAMKQAVQSDVFIAAAAVSDYRPANPTTEKHKKGHHGTLTLALIENPDIVATVSALPAPQRPLTVGFAAETENLRDYARQKRKNKRLDLIVANDVTSDVFGSADNAALLIDDREERNLPRQSKTALAEQILDRIATLLKETHDPD